MAFRFCLLRHNLPAVLLSVLRGIPGRSVFQAPLLISRRIWHQFQITGAEALRFLKPCDSIAERTFPVFVDFLNILDAEVLLVQTSALLMRRPGGLTETDLVSFK